MILGRVQIVSKIKIDLGVMVIFSGSLKISPFSPIYPVIHTK
ncbi:hypothetical protein [Alysiella crassa]|nr:hypothetical protein [Alysiella crassa]